MEHRDESPALFECHLLFNRHDIRKISSLGAPHLALRVFVQICIVSHTNSELHQSYHKWLILLEVVRPRGNQQMLQTPNGTKLTRRQRPLDLVSDPD